MVDAIGASTEKSAKSMRQLGLYALIGVASNVLGYLLYLAITHAGVAPKVAMSFLYAFGATAGFWGNRQLTFSHRGKVLGAGFRYVIAHCLGYLLNFMMLEIGVNWNGYSHQWVQAVAIFVVAAYLFAANKYFVFQEADVVCRSPT